MRSKLIDRLKQVNKYHVLILVTVMLSAILLIYLTDLKVGMHIDEYLTYGLANNEADSKNKITPEYGVRIAATDVFDVFFYPDGFSIRNVWLNQGNNVHPPLYYLLFHIFILVTHSFLTLKTGILLNIIFHMINIVLVWLIIKEMLHKEYEALFGAVLYAFMPVILGNVLFMRMYMLMSAYLLGLTLLFIRAWNKSDRKIFYIKLGIISVCGTLTHYYFLIYLFFCCLVWGICILKDRKWKELIGFIVTMAASGIVCVLIFPYMLEHIFTGAAGERTIKNLFSSAFLKNVKKFADAIDSVYGGFLFAVIVTAVVVLIFSCIIWKKDEKGQKREFRWVMIAFPCILYFLTITWIAIAAATRYISPIYPVCIILLIGLFDKLASYMTGSDKAKCMAGILLLAVLLNNAWKTYSWTELHLDAEECINTARKYGVNNECIYVMNVTWHSFTSYQEFIQYQNMTFIRDDNMDLLYTDDYADYDHVVMYFDKNIGEAAMEEILENMIEMNPGLDTYEKLHEYAYNYAYYLE